MFVKIEVAAGVNKFPEEEEILISLGCRFSLLERGYSYLGKKTFSLV